MYSWRQAAGGHRGSAPEPCLPSITCCDQAQDGTPLDRLLSAGTNDHGGARGAHGLQNVGVHGRGLSCTPSSGLLQAQPYLEGATRTQTTHHTRSGALGKGGHFVM